MAGRDGESDQPLLNRLVFYLLFYGNTTTNAKKALKAFQQYVQRGGNHDRRPMIPTHRV